MKKPAEDGYTPRYIAAQQVHVKIVQLLLPRLQNIDTTQSNNNGVTTLSVASQNGHLEIVKVLLERDDVDVNRADNDLVTPLNIACANGEVDVVKYLLQQPTISLSLNKNDQWNNSPLDSALQNQHNEIAQLLQEASAIQSVQPTTTCNM